ncbi:hypothetical protein GCM10009113_26030 [Marinobacter szutsaonensis]
MPESVTTGTKPTDFCLISRSGTVPAGSPTPKRGKLPSLAPPSDTATTLTTDLQPHHCPENPLLWWPKGYVAKNGTKFASQTVSVAGFGPYRTATWL